MHSDLIKVEGATFHRCKDQTWTYLLVLLKPVEARVTLGQVLGHIVASQTEPSQ